MKFLFVMLLTFSGLAFAQFPPPFCPPHCSKPPSMSPVAAEVNLTPSLTPAQGKAAIGFVLKANAPNCICLDMEGTMCCKFTSGWVCEGGYPGCGGVKQPASSPIPKKRELAMVSLELVMRDAGK